MVYSDYTLKSAHFKDDIFHLTTKTRQGLHVFSSYAISTAAISTAAISTVHTFNRSHFQPLAFSTACKFNRHKFDLFN